MQQMERGDRGSKFSSLRSIQVRKKPNKILNIVNQLDEKGDEDLKLMRMYNPYT